MKATRVKDTASQGVVRQDDSSRHARWPFPVDNFPVFYGWMIWFISTVGMIMSIPGQTMGMSVFTDYFIEAFGLTRTQLSTAYLFGTLSSATFLIRAGRFYDRSGARISIVAASIGLGLCVSYIATIDLIVDATPGFAASFSTWITFALIFLGYFGVRFSGQGVLTSASRNVLLEWFERRRGMVTGARNVLVTLAFSLAPPILAFLISSFGWRGALFALAAIVGVGFSVMALLLVRNSPRSCGLKVDGKKSENVGAPDWSVPDKTPQEAKRSPVFWIYTASLSVYSLFVTALVFHIVSIFNSAGRTAEEAVTYFFPAAIVSVTVNLLASWLSDRWPLKRLLLLMLASFIVGALGILFLQNDIGYWLLAVGFGASGGLWGVLSNLAFVRFFGCRFLGEISGINTSFTVVGSAIGPVMFSVGLDLFGSYHAVTWALMLAACILIVAAIVIKQEDPVLTRRAGSD